MCRTRAGGPLTPPGPRRPHPCDRVTVPELVGGALRRFVSFTSMFMAVARKVNLDRDNLRQIDALYPLDRRRTLPKRSSWSPGCSSQPHASVQPRLCA